jgi:hypothetical protein
MSGKTRKNRKSTDNQITRLNGLGLSLSTVARLLNCHPTSITLRLQSLKIPPADTRRAFMESIYFALPEADQTMLADLIEENQPATIKDYVRVLIEQDLEFRKQAAQSQPAQQAQQVQQPEEAEPDATE